MGEPAQEAPLRSLPLPGKPDRTSPPDRPYGGSAGAAGAIPAELYSGRVSPRSSGRSLGLDDPLSDDPLSDEDLERLDQRLSGVWGLKKY